MASELENLLMRRDKILRVLLRCLESSCLILVKGRLMASGEEEGLSDFLPEQAAQERVGGGLPRLRFAERMQTRWRPVSLDGLLPDDHRVRLVWSFVEGLDLTTIKAVDGRPHSGGPADSAGALVVCHRGGDWQRPRGCAVV
jgi:hypothetical protein